MRQIRTMMLALLPVLWLAGSLHGSLTPAGLFPPVCLPGLDSTVETTASEPVPGCTTDSSPHVLLHRARGLPNARTPATRAGQPFPSRDEAAVLTAEPHAAEAPLELAKAWQFTWRAARAPRAPSSPA